MAYIGTHKDQQSRKCKIGKHQDKRTSIDSGFKNAHPSATDWLSSLLNVYYN